MNNKGDLGEVHKHKIIEEEGKNDYLVVRIDYEKQRNIDFGKKLRGISKVARKLKKYKNRRNVLFEVKSSENCKFSIKNGRGTGFRSQPVSHIIVMIEKWELAGAEVYLEKQAHAAVEEHVVEEAAEFDDALAMDFGQEDIDVQEVGLHRQEHRQLQDAPAQDDNQKCQKLEEELKEMKDAMNEMKNENSILKASLKEKSEKVGVQETMIEAMAAEKDICMKKQKEADELLKQNSKTVQEQKNSIAEMEKKMETIEDKAEKTKRLHEEEKEDLCKNKEALIKNWEGAWMKEVEKKIKQENEIKQLTEEKAKIQKKEQETLKLLNKETETVKRQRDLIVCMIKDWNENEKRHKMQFEEQEQLHQKKSQGDFEVSLSYAGAITKAYKEIIEKLEDSKKKEAQNHQTTLEKSLKDQKTELTNFYDEKIDTLLNIIVKREKDIEEQKKLRTSDAKQMQKDFDRTVEGIVREHHRLIKEEQERANNNL